ncbi:EAL domain-containing protein [Aeromonas salmonicida]
MEVERAIKCDEFNIYCQPIVDIIQSELVGVEILVRWKHSVIGDVRPDDFIPLLESSYICGDFCEMLLEKTIRIICSSPKVKALLTGKYVSINIPPTYFSSKKNIETIIGSSKKLNREGISIAIELTERQDLECMSDIHLSMRALQAEGILIFMDDFGSGFASINSLIKLPFDVIKVDRLYLEGFFKDMDGCFFSGEWLDKYFCKSQMGIIFEGVETRKQLMFLKDRGVRYIQGYYVSHPTMLEEIHNEFVSHYDLFY